LSFLSIRFFSGVISSKSKDRQYNGQKKTLNRKLKIELHEPHTKTGVNSSALEGYAVPAALVVSMVLLLFKIL